MAGKIKTWVWVVVAIVVICVLGVVADRRNGLLLLHEALRHAKSRHRPAPAVEFERVKTQFAGQKPLIELDERGRISPRRTPIGRPMPTRAGPEQLYVLAFDPDDERIVKVTIPFWLLRLSRAARSTSTAASSSSRISS